MFTKLEDALKNDKLDQIFALEKQGQLNLTKVIKAGTLYFKVQDDFHEGNGIYFSSKDESRFSILDKSKGTMYLAESPHTGLLEYFHDAKDEDGGFLDKSDLESGCMAEIEIIKDFRVLNVSQFSPHIDVPVGELMGDNPIYPLTQQLAQKLSKMFDGMEYVSRQNGERCLVLWSDNQGEEILLNKSVTHLVDYEHESVSARVMLQQKCGIQIT
ncbi:RES family NAD+ phosphorylase [Acinetobacter kyonggiensis]|uniref:RES domain-containing protein n=1 Tax=Acinetobacter kyonggiensis TaxID=595670 RepID=A0A1H3NMF2_9GAMM|nr:RES family NAD+ phosphorylase [Acinetobacter kyonggiensis]SDY89984.1 RES domain-containing protein [Acinetobacter kyonggiensis]